MIEIFARVNKNARFTLTEKVDVNGANASPLYEFLKGNYLSDEDPLKDIFSGEIVWNFEYFLVDQKGKVVNRWPTGTDMKSEHVTSFIKETLGMRTVHEDL